MRSLSAAWAVGAVLWLGVVPPASAGDGRREINQACAAVGCFAGDGPGFPVTIDSPGSYVLTGSLKVSDPNQSGIVIPDTVSAAAIDLNGFEIVGPVTCTGAGSTMTCGSGSGIGIHGRGGDLVAVNGKIRGFGSGAILVDPELASKARIEGVIAEANGGRGIETGPFSIVRHCVARQNGGVGISVDGVGTVDDSIAAYNKSVGIFGSAFAVTVTDSTAYNNGHDGIATRTAGLIRGNVSYLNRMAGLAAGPGSTVIDNTAFSNFGIGIYAEDRSMVSRNTVSQNGGFGLSLTATTTYRENTINANAATVSSGINMGNNSCNGTTTCP